MSLLCDRVAAIHCQTSETVALRPTPYLTTAVDTRPNRGDSHVSGRSGRSMDSPSVPMKRSNDGSAFDLTHAIRLHIEQKDAQAKMENKRSLVTKVKLLVYYQLSALRRHHIIHAKTSVQHQ